MSDENNLPTEINNQVMKVDEALIHSVTNSLSPSRKLESNFGEFVTDTFDIVRQRENHINALRELFMDKAKNGEVDTDQLIVYINNEEVNANTLSGNTVAPLSTILISAANKEAEAMKAENQKIILEKGASGDINKMTIPTDVQVGFNALSQLASLIGTLNPAQKSEPKIINGSEQQS